MSGHNVVAGVNAGPDLGPALPCSDGAVDVPNKAKGAHAIAAPAPASLPCSCGSDATSLNPAEVVVHRSGGPCFIAPATTGDNS